MFWKFWIKIRQNTLYWAIVLITYNNYRLLWLVKTLGGQWRKNTLCNILYAVHMGTPPVGRQGRQNKGGTKNYCGHLRFKTVLLTHDYAVNILLKTFN